MGKSSKMYRRVMEAALTKRVLRHLLSPSPFFKLGLPLTRLQHDMTLDNQAGAAYRADNNNALQALASTSSGASAPSVSFAYQEWADTTTSLLKRRNAANTSWIVRDTLAETLVLSRSTNTILSISDHKRTIIATSAFTQTFNSAASLGDGWEIVYINASTGNIILDPNASEQIDGGTTLVLAPGESCIIKCNGTSLRTQGLGTARGSFNLVDNLTLSVTASGTLTIALKNRFGNDPTAANPIRIPFRSLTAGNGDYTELLVTAATSLVVSSGSTLGTVSAQAHRLYIVGINDSGTLRLGIYNPWDNTTKSLRALVESELQSSTAEGGAGAADSAHVLYASTGVASKPIRILGFIESTQATAGTWNTAPSKIQIMGPGVPKTGDVIQIVRHIDGSVATGTGTIPDDNTIPQITEGNEFMTVSITPTNAANMIEVDTKGNVANQAGSSAITIAALFQDATANALVSTQEYETDASPTWRGPMLLLWVAIANGVSAITYRFRAGQVNAGTTTFNGASGGAGRHGGTLHSHMIAREIFV